MIERRRSETKERAKLRIRRYRSLARAHRESAPKLCPSCSRPLQAPYVDPRQARTAKTRPFASQLEAGMWRWRCSWCGAGGYVQCTISRKSSTK